MSKPFDVCIRGSGVVGRTLALLLARERLHVALVAPATATSAPVLPPVQDVRAYALNSASRQLLESLRAWPQAPFVTAVQQMQVWGDAGGRLDFIAETPPSASDQAGLGACRAWGVESENRPQRGQFLPELQPHSPAM